MAEASAISSNPGPSVPSNGLAYSSKDGGVLAMTSNTGNIQLDGKLFVDAGPNTQNPFSKLFASSVNTVA